MNTSNHIEALLFLSGEPLNVSRLCKILDKKEGDINQAINELEAELKDRGLRLLKKNGEVMLGASPDSSKYCEALLKEELDKTLGRAGLETLAIILYKDGVSRADIDYIRGVNSTFTLRNLLIRGLVERKINPKDKRSYVYSPSMKMLQYLGITKKEDLPEFENFIKQIEDAVEFNQSN
jgi:segregation and condensation protein B